MTTDLNIRDRALAKHRHLVAYRKNEVLKQQREKQAQRVIWGRHAVQRVLQIGTGEAVVLIPEDWNGEVVRVDGLCLRIHDAPQGGHSRIDVFISEAPGSIPEWHQIDALDILGAILEHGNPADPADYRKLWNEQIETGLTVHVKDLGKYTGEGADPIEGGNWKDEGQP